MRDKQAIKILLKTITLTFIAMIASIMFKPVPVKAVIIEGFDSNGNFRTVQVSTTGRLLVDNGSIGTAQAVFFVTSQPVTAFQGTSPWIVSFTDPVTVDGIVDVQVTSCTVPVPSNIALAASVQAQLLAASATRCGSVVCNEDTGVSLYVGPSGVSTATGKLIPPGSCLSPDVPSVFRGALFGISTAALANVGVFETTP